MAISYNRLWKQLIDHGLSKTDMMHRAKISTNVLARLSKGEPVSMDSMEKICTMLGCNIGDVMEFIPSEAFPISQSGFTLAESNIGYSERKGEAVWQNSRSKRFAHTFFRMEGKPATGNDLQRNG